MTSTICFPVATKYSPGRSLRRLKAEMRVEVTIGGQVFVVVVFHVLSLSPGRSPVCGFGLALGLGRDRHAGSSRMAGEHQAIGLHERREAGQDFVLGRLVEVNHDIPAEDDIHRPLTG